MSVPKLRVYLSLGLCITGLVWGAHTCLYHLNRVLDPPQPIRALEFQRLDEELLLCNVLGVDLVLAVPRDPRPRWSPLSEPLPGGLSNLDASQRRL